ncbi:glycosyltransferase family 4 protein [Mesorhizobium sp. B1-1-1]|uniref:glycosyltransferase n=1 Tax=Mesorhizobium sp. B1-1-1 TaxID=2589983 RepID=UPI001126D5B2|nr:glycosyltransferase [Mesorhizobium sp. B1-1-1]TPN65746.1 glycosyltransferase family 4 protein [Mesorhizobium sp. B1-1-1]
MTKPGTVLLLSTYPIVKPQHGGQVRLLNIKRAYESAGWKVTPLAVYPEEGYQKSSIGPDDILFPLDSPHRLFNGRHVPFVTDITSGAFASSEDGGLPQILASISGQIDVIHVEQPWLWPLAKTLRERQQYSSSLLVYGSQNIEAPLKRGIFNDWNVVEFEDAIEAVDRLERQAAREADLTIAVTQDEVDVLTSWGTNNVKLLPNGIEPWQADEEAIAEWRQRLPKHPWLLYVASAHPPNFTGFAQVFGESLGCFPPTSKLVVAGSVTEHIYRVMNNTKWSTLNLSRLQLLFPLPDRDLAAVKTLAHGFILPIPFGGGSNIKTAEALYSGAYVVGTPSAYRGFESFIDLPEVFVGGNAKEFQRAIRDVLIRPRASPLQAGSEQLERRKSLRWDVCLACLPAMVKKLKCEKCA